MMKASPTPDDRKQLDELRRLQAAAQHFAAIVEFSDDAIVSKDLDGVVVSWNPAAERLFGYRADEMIGRPIRVIIPPDRQTEEDAVLAAVRRGDTVDHFETVRQRKDGSFVPISLTVSPIRDAAGQVVGASKIARDLTRVERAQRDALRLAAIVDSSDDAIISKDLDGIIRSWNGAAERMFGFAADEIVGKSVRVLIPEDRQDEEDEVLARIRAGHRVEHFETMRLRRDGSLVAVSLTVSPILRADGTVAGASKIARDITDRKQAEQERERLLEIAREASRLKDEFLATLSHELRTPLNGIVGYVRLLQIDLRGDEKRTSSVDAVGRCVASLTQIIEDVLDVSRIVSGKLRLEIARSTSPKCCAARWKPSSRRSTPRTSGCRWCSTADCRGLPAMPTGSSRCSGTCCRMRSSSRRVAVRFASASPPPARRPRSASPIPARGSHSISCLTYSTAFARPMPA